MKSKKKYWIQEAIQKKGALRKTAGVKSGKNIPQSKLQSLSHSKSKKTAARARLAMTLAKLRKK